MRNAISSVLALEIRPLTNLLLILVLISNSLRERR